MASRVHATGEKGWAWLIQLLTVLVLATGPLRGQGVAEAEQFELSTLQRFRELAPTLPDKALVKLQGAVTLFHRGGSIFIQDQSDALFVHAVTNSSIALGDVVEVAGYLNRDGYSPTLRDATYRSLGRRELVRPERVTGPTLVSGRYDMRLVSLDGKLITDPRVRGDTQVLHVESDHTVINLELSHAGQGGLVSQLRSGSLLHVTGVCSVGGSSGRPPTTVRLHLRSGDDVRVLAPPAWWTPARTAYVAVATGAAALLALGWVVTLRREVRRKTEQIAERLRRQTILEERYRRIVDTALEGVLLLDNEGRIQFLNGYMAEMLGVPAPQVAGRHFIDFVHMESKPQVEAVRPDRPTRSRPGAVDLRLRHPDGSDIWVLAAFSPFLNEHGAPDGTLAMVTNITGRKAAEDRIAQLNDALEKRVHERTEALALANRELEAFSYSVSHDLRAPLRSIAGFSTALNEDFGSSLPAEAQLHLTRIRNSAIQMSHLIDGLLSLGRVTRVELVREETDLTTLATAVWEEIKQSTQASPRIEIQPGLKDLVDRNLMRIVFTNLLQNACKFTRKAAEPLIEVGRISSDPQPVYFVRDNGAGFDPAHSGRLFKVFQRLHSATEYEGSGVGLATIQRIVERHGGRIWAEGKVNGGASFYFTLHPDLPRDREGQTKS